MSPDSNPRSSLFGVLFYPALILGVLIVIAILVVSFKSAPESGAAGSQTNGNERQLSDQTLSQFKDKFDALGMAVGNPDAPVTIREFGDYQCPACASFAPTAKRIRDTLVKAGRVRFIFFDFPLPMHAHSQQAAEAARCAARQHRFWPFHDRVYAAQDQWAEKQNARPVFLDVAVESGVDTKRLERCMNQGAVANEIAQEKDAGTAVKLRATPTVIVGRTLFSGAPSYQRIQQIVDRLSPAQSSAADNASASEAARPAAG